MCYSSRLSKTLKTNFSYANQQVVLKHMSVRLSLHIFVYVTEEYMQKAEIVQSTTLIMLYNLP